MDGDRFMSQQGFGHLTPYKEHKTNPLGTLLNSVGDTQKDCSVQAISRHW